MSAISFFAKGQTFERAADYDAAIKEYRAALEVNADFGPAADRVELLTHYVAGLACEAGDNYRGALREYRAAVARDSEFRPAADRLENAHEVGRSRALDLQRAGEFATAEKILRDLWADDPSSGRAIFLLANLKAAMGERHEAFQLMKLLLSWSQDWLDVYINLIGVAGYTLLARIEAGEAGPSGAVDPKTVLRPPT